MSVPVPVPSFITGSKYPNASSWDWLSPPLKAEDNHILRPHHLAGVYTTPLHLNDGEYHQHLLHFIDHWARFCNIGLNPSSPHLKEIILTYLLLLLHVLFQGLSLISFCCREEGGSPPTYTTLHYHLCPPKHLCTTLHLIPPGAEPHLHLHHLQKEPSHCRLLLLLLHLRLLQHFKCF